MTSKSGLSVAMKYVLFAFPPLVVTCNPLISFANSLDTDQARQNVQPYQDPNHLIL